MTILKIYVALLSAVLQHSSIIFPLASTFLLCFYSDVIALLGFSGLSITMQSHICKICALYDKRYVCRKNRTNQSECIFLLVCLSAYMYQNLQEIFDYTIERSFRNIEYCFENSCARFPNNFNLIILFRLPIFDYQCFF